MRALRGSPPRASGSPAPAKSQFAGGGARANCVVGPARFVGDGLLRAARSPKLTGENTMATGDQEEGSRGRGDEGRLGRGTAAAACSACQSAGPVHSPESTTALLDEIEGAAGVDWASVFFFRRTPDGIPNGNIPPNVPQVLRSNHRRMRGTGRERASNLWPLHASACAFFPLPSHHACAQHHSDSTRQPAGRQQSCRAVGQQTSGGALPAAAVQSGNHWEGFAETAFREGVHLCSPCCLAGQQIIRVATSSACQQRSCPPETPATLHHSHLISDR